MFMVPACDNGTYGTDCMEFCGKCLDNEQCHHINGTCFSGCDPGYQGLNCTESKLLYIFSTNEQFTLFNNLLRNYH